MRNDLFTVIIAGKAGEGVRKAGSVVANLFASMGREVLQMDDYQSLIKGGHNFSVVTISKEKVTSHYIKANIVISLDSKSYELHRDHILEDGVMVYNSDVVEHGSGVGIPFPPRRGNTPDQSLDLVLVRLLSCVLL